jgi:hypothetical protein
VAPSRRETSSCSQFLPLTFPPNFETTYNHLEPTQTASTTYSTADFACLIASIERKPTSSPEDLASTSPHATESERPRQRLSDIYIPDLTYCTAPHFLRPLSRSFFFPTLLDLSLIFRAIDDVHSQSDTRIRTHHVFSFTSLRRRRVDSTISFPPFLRSRFPSSTQRRTR